jgi:hypothetical protein
MTEAELRFRPVQAGLTRTEAIGAVVARAWPTVFLRALEEEEWEEDDAPLGASRLGGAPDLPPDVEAPDAFLGQLNLAEVAPYLPQGVLPAAGLLSYFGNGVLYFRDVTDLSRRDDDQPQLLPCRVEFLAGLSLPHRDGPEVAAAGLTPAELTAYENVAAGAFQETAEYQQLLGCPQELTLWLGVPAVVVLEQRVRRRSLRYDELSPEQRRELIERLDRRWCMLLQLNGFGDLNFGKGGCCQFWIERTALRALDFSGVRVLDDPGL